MMRFYIFLTFFFALALADYAVFEKIPSIPNGWQKLPAAPSPLTLLDLRIHLKTDHPKLEQELLAISDPTSDRYGLHHTRESLLAFTKPCDDAITAVKTWLKNANLSFDISEDIIKVRLTVAQAEALLQTTYAAYENKVDKRIVIRTLQYSVPPEVGRYVAMVQPTTMFGLRPQRSGQHGMAAAPFEFVSAAANTGKSRSLPACDNIKGNMTLQCLAELYGYVGYKSEGKASIGISGFLEQSAQFHDLELFLKKYKPKAAGAKFDIELIHGGEAPQNVTNYSNMNEANLDVQYAISIAWPAKTTFYSTGGRPSMIFDVDNTQNNNEPYLEYLDYLLKQDTLPTVISTSYADTEQTVPVSYRHTVCNMFARLGARGVSVLFGSGDTGPGWSCRANDGTNDVKFLPEFPASCPWVTAVGATWKTEPEEAIFFSSGGFSDTFPVPDYQASAVKTYFNEHPDAWQPWTKYFNQSGRGFPDVAAQGNNYEFFINGTKELISGTSASCPTFAAIITLVNDYRLRHGKAQLGFLNPLLYKNPIAFTDVVKGKSQGCNGTVWGRPIVGNFAIVPDAGWDAVEGWDPVTGLGTPKFDMLLNI